MDPLLVCAPLPFDTESFHGYLLRVAEANGYESPRLVLRAAGVEGVKMEAARLDSRWCEQALGLDSVALRRLSNAYEHEDGSPAFAILGHHSERLLRDGQIRSSRPAFCPRCVAEQGFLDAFWDLKFAVVCPIHRCTVLEACPTCKKELQWGRPGILTCHCGASLADAELLPVDDTLLIDLMAVLKHKLHGLPFDSFSNRNGFPLDAIERVSLWRFFSLLNKLATHNCVSKGAPAPDSPQRVATTAAEVLADWPHGFRAFLRREGDRTGALGLTVVGINARFRAFYHSLFKSPDYQGDFDFLREEYTRFGLTEWGDSVVDDRAATLANDSKRFVSKSELARHLGVTRKTVDAWVKRGTVTAKEICTSKNKRYIADTTTVLVPRRVDGQTLTVKAAAKYLGLPIPVLKELRRCGRYRVSTRASRLLAYHQHDVEEFKENLLAKASGAPIIATVPPTMITLRRALTTLKFGTPDLKARLVEAYLDGGLKPVARTGDDAGGICFNRDEALRMSQDIRVDFVDGALTIRQVSLHLQCNFFAVLKLLEWSYLKPHWSPGHRRVEKHSLEEFCARYIRIRDIAVREKTSSERLAHIAELAGARLLKVEYRSKARIIFLLREDEEKLLREAEKHPARDRKGQ